jgi:tetratricopeptide (TPR) repeat protein
MVPVMIHRVRGQGLARAGRADEAGRAAKLCFDNCPGDADSQIEIVRALQDAGHRPQADEAYERAKAHYAKLAADYPESGPAHNLVAWFQGRCRRDLDDALAHAKKAAELEPASTAILDTLAEVHFQRGEIDPALELVHRCIKTEPGNPHHRKNLERFTAAKQGGGTTRPGGEGAG